VFHARTGSVLATRELGAAIADLLRPGDVILLAGDLGAGKTAFVQGLGLGLGVAEQITSPTFTLVGEYHGRLPLHHVDVYRLERPEEVFDLALPELLEDGVTAVEWGELIRPALGSDYLQLSLRFADPDHQPDERAIEILPVGPSWTARNPAIRSAVRPWTEVLA
jgi:tRNA threonylcarbamoyladenosine biosynthesis protein TsaE